jgi:hypothetical protein
MTLIYNKNTGTTKPSTHAVIIGVGVYDHLPGGKGNLCPSHQGMGQLSSPPVSAVEISRWLIEEYNNPECPLSSLDLLISAEPKVNLTIQGVAQTSVEPAKMEEIKRAVKAWKERGDENEENIMIFYFCGHGIASGLLLSLLPQDYGKDANAIFETAIDFNKFYLGMDKCKSRKQCFFIDACRSASSNLIESADYYGNPIIDPSRRLEGQRLAPIYYSTLAGDQSYSKPKSTSIYTSAILKAFRGAGSDNINISEEWKVDTESLHRGISQIIELTREERNNQYSSVDHLAGFNFHKLKGKPIVPVSIGCDPPDANGYAKYSYSNGSTYKENEYFGTPPWLVEIEEDIYDFEAKFPHKQYEDSRAEKKSIRPPVKFVKIVTRRI